MLTQAKLSTKDYTLKLYKTLKSSGWDNILKGFILSEDFLTIVKTLETFVKDKRHFSPTFKQLFRAFQECPYNKTNVIIIGQNPNSILGWADGLAFSCGNIKKQDANLRYIFNAINSTVYNNEKDITEFNPDLKNWANQGILLLNLALTTEINKQSHIELWKPFIIYLLDMLNYSNSNYIWVLIGEKAQQYENLIDNHSNSVILKTSHPAEAEYKKLKEWDCNNIFNNINKSLEKQKLSLINW